MGVKGVSGTISAGPLVSGVRVRQGSQTETVGDEGGSGEETRSVSSMSALRHRCMLSGQPSGGVFHARYIAFQKLSN